MSRKINCLQIDALGHSWADNWQEYTPATCEEKGYTTHTCTKCGDSYTYSETAVIAHSYKTKVTNPTCTAMGFTPFTCEVCKHSYTADDKAALGHNIGAFVVVKQPTCTENGTGKADCSRCNYSDTKSISSKGHNYQNGVCANCVNSKMDSCDHMYHKTGFMGFIWKIVRFFWTLFIINPTCDCGVAHY